MDIENRIDEYLVNEISYGHEDDMIDDVKGIIKWLNDFRTSYEAGNKRLARGLLGDIRKQVDKMIKRM